MKKQALRIQSDGSFREMELRKVVEVDLNAVDKEFVYFERLSDGKWRMIYTKKTIPDIRKFFGLYLVWAKKETAV